MSFSILLLQNVQPKAGTPSVAQDSSAPPQGGASQSPGGGSMLTMLLPFVLFIPIFFLMFRKQKKETEARKQLKKGDRVVSTSGLIGELIELDERVARVKIAPGTTVQMLANSIAPVPAEPVATELKDAKAVSDKK